MRMAERYSAWMPRTSLPPLGYWMNVRSIFVLRANFSALAVGGGEGRRGGRGRGVDNHVKSMERGGRARDHNKSCTKTKAARLARANLCRDVDMAVGIDQPYSAGGSGPAKKGSGFDHKNTALAKPQPPHIQNKWFNAS